jgi:hypothetical protein
MHTTTLLFWEASLGIDSSDHSFIPRYELSSARIAILLTRNARPHTFVLEGCFLEGSTRTQAQSRLYVSETQEGLSPY